MATKFRVECNNCEGRGVVETIVRQGRYPMVSPDEMCEMRPCQFSGCDNGVLVEAYCRECGETEDLIGSDAVPPHFCDGDQQDFVCTSCRTDPDCHLSSCRASEQMSQAEAASDRMEDR